MADDQIVPPYLQPTALDQALTPDINNPPDMTGVNIVPQGGVNWPAESGVVKYQNIAEQAQQNNMARPQVPAQTKEQLPSPESLVAAKAQPAPAGAQPVAQPAPVSYVDQLNKLAADTSAQFDIQKKAVQDAADIATTIETKKTDLYKQQVKSSEDAERAVAEGYKQAGERVEQQYQERQKAINAYREMLTPEKVNEAFRPNGVFENKSVGQSILGAIAIGLGGIGAAGQGPGATNQALSMIMKQLDKENEGKVNAFKTGLAGQQTLAGEASKSAQMARQQGSDTATNALQNKALQLETIQAKIEQMASPYKGQMAQAKAQELIAGIQKEKNAVESLFKQQQLQRELTNSLGNLSYEQYDKLNPAQKASIPEPIRKQYEDMKESFVPGYGVAGNKNLAQEFIKQKDAVEPALAGLKRVDDLANNYNKILGLTTLEGRNQRAKIQSEIVSIIGSLRIPLTGPGILTDGEVKRLKSIIGDPSDFLSLSSTQKAHRDEMKRILEDNLAQKAKGAGLPVKSGTDFEAEQAAKFGRSKPKF